MEEQEHIHNPFQFEYASSTRKFSVRMKLMAILLVLIFISVPLYEISPETFKEEYIYIPCQLYGLSGPLL